MKSGQMRTGSLGYPRIGENREWKKALEAHWSGKLDEAGLRLALEELLLSYLLLQKDKGLDYIPVNDFSYYDHMLDMATMFGVVPSRFGHTGGPASLDTYFAMARGQDAASACEMTKWFNTNYHYIVPELGEAAPYLAENRPLQAYRFARSRAGIAGKPVIVGLYTFLKLSKGYDAVNGLAEKAAEFLPVYITMLKELAQEGVAWVQLDEPALVLNPSETELGLVEEIYTAIHTEVPGLQVQLQTYFGAVADLERISRLPAAAIGLDFVHDKGRNLQALSRLQWPADKQLAAGVIDGRNIWRSDLDAKLVLIGQLLKFVPAEQIVLQPSCSLLHVPVTTRHEVNLPSSVAGAMAYANEKLAELVLLSRLVQAPVAEDLQALAESRSALAYFDALPERCRNDVAEEIAGLAAYKAARAAPFAQRFKLQADKWQLPLLPTTTIGSFPQTPEVRQARLKWRRGEWEVARYEAFIRQEIAACIKVQEELDLDVLVHGEFERTDMVEFFGEKLAGFVFTRNGWVQSYGSRCVKPPVIYADVAFLEPMTVKESAYAQSLTSRPVKGMLTGPITILNWSFVRDDLPRQQVAFQIALALKKEVEALEAAGIRMIQVDEPALREGLPLAAGDQSEYLQWAIEAFRISTSSVENSTQIHTHMCYCEFHDMIDSILALDADVISIETSRSHGELVSSFELNGYDHGIGLGVYDIHSPRVPAVEEMLAMAERALRVLDPELFWINPDCGLKTRGWPETIAALRNMTAAASLARQKLSGINV